MSENKRVVTFEEAATTPPGLREVHRDNEAVIKVLDRMEQCMLCARGCETTSANQSPVQMTEELIQSVKRTVIVMTNLITDTPVTRVDSQIQMYNMLSVGLNRDLEKMFGLLMILAKHVTP